MVVVKGYELIKVSVTGGQRPDLSVVIGPETLRSLVVHLISRCWHQTPDDRPTFAGICLSVSVMTLEALPSVRFYLKFLGIAFWTDLATYLNLLTTNLESALE